MVVDPGPPEPAASLADAKAYLRVGSGDEDALIAGLLGSATALGEAFMGTLLLAREVSETVSADGGWRRLARTPVAAILGVDALAADGSGTALPVDRYAVDIDCNGDGWVRVTGGGLARVRYRAGLAATAAALPTPIAQGVVRLVAHLHAHRDAADEAAPPAAVAALWRPYRRMRLA